MGILGSIFGTPEIIKGGINLIDKAFNTEQEKAEHHIKLLNAYAPFKLAQRYISFVFLFNFSLSFWILFLMSIFDLNITFPLEVVEAFSIGWVMLTIVLFYFGGGTIESLKKEKQ